MNRIKELRKFKRISQIDLANFLDVSQQTISTYENSSREPDIKTVRILANYFNVSIDYLLGETDIVEKYEDASIFLGTLKEKLLEAGYDLSEKSSTEISEIILLALSLIEKIKE